ncbi:tRNA (adenosine(37)-N6)-threonylcarbamoyltransferase complex transferase subunit TsaD [Candidatus Parcubacteria bacterium]|nr:tRNA (adenosine(37)-N6)-threonylcarbamoyltransferase complex transferase subunit TsaD [Candidatus Parcubacteria bacterium]
MRILAIETSCDETAVAVLECSGTLPVPEFKVLGNSLMSQIHIHKEYGGVYPMLAKREHIKNLPILLPKTMQEADNSDVDYIAVTSGPGLEPALWTGIEFAKELGKKWGKRVIPVNHMEGHLFSYMFEQSKPIEFPAIALLVSGGHTELVHVEDFDKYKIIGRTRDDAVGEAFDKTARLLGLPYPGGPKISELAEISRNRGGVPAFHFPRPMIKSGDLNFSYSGLKTSVLYTTRKLGELDLKTKESLAEAFEDAAIEPLVEKTRAAANLHGAKTLIVGGGVAANKLLRKNLQALADELSLDFRLPIQSLTTDNAIMIGIAAYVRLLTNRAESPDEIVARGNLDL